MKSILVKVALTAVNWLIRKNDKLLLKHPQNGTFLKIQEDLLEVRKTLTNLNW